VAPLVWLGVLLGALLGAAPGAAADEPSASPGWSQELERGMMSPYCPGRSLIECPSPQATELRLWIQAQEKAGVPRQDVEARLFAQFGDQLRQAPRAEGWGLWAYLVPAGALLAGGAIVLAYLARNARPQAAAAAPSGAVDPDVQREIDRELEER
jgi:cytochrome c-type biogenesis protein CcmH